MIRFVLLLLPVSAKVVRSRVSVDETAVAFADAGEQDFSFEAFADAEEQGAAPEEAEEGRYARRGGVVPGCEYIVVDHSTTMALWVEDKLNLPKSLAADEITFKCKDGYSRDGKGPFSSDWDNMHITVKCHDKKSTGAQDIVSCKPVECEYDRSHPLFNAQDAHAPPGGIFDVLVYRTTKAEWVYYEKETRKRVFKPAVKEWVPLMSSAAVTSQDPKELYGKMQEFLPKALSGEEEVPSSLGSVRIPQDPVEMYAFGRDLESAVDDVSHPLHDKAVKIFSLDGTYDHKLFLTKISPCPPQKRGCLTYYRYQAKEQLKTMAWASEKLRKVMHEAIAGAVETVSIKDRLGHDTHLWLKVKEGLEYSFDGATHGPHMRNVVLYCDATGGLEKGIWYVDKVTTQAVLPRDAPETAGEMAPSFAPDELTDDEAVGHCEEFRAQVPHGPVRARACHGFKKVVSLCADGTPIPAELEIDYSMMLKYCRSHEGVQSVERPGHVELVVTSVHAFPIVCRDLLQHLSALKPNACPEDGTFAEELEGLTGDALQERLRVLREKGHPCGLRGWGGLELGKNGKLRPIPLHEEHAITCALGYAINGADMALDERGLLAPPVTELSVRCVLVDGHAVAQQGVLSEPASKELPMVFTERPDAQCVPIQCNAPQEMYANAEATVHQREEAGACLTHPDEPPFAIYSHGCDVRIQCEEHHAFPELDGRGEVVYSWTARCHEQSRLMEPHHGCMPMECADDNVRAQNSSGALLKDRVLTGEHQELLADTPLRSGEQYDLPCDEGFTTDGNPYREGPDGNRAFVLQCIAHEGHDEQAMRRPHLECVNCHEVVHASELSEEECHPVTCAVPAPQVMGDVELLQVHFSTDQTAFDGDVLGGGVVEFVPYKTEVSVRCATGYELYRDGEKVRDVSAHTWLPLGLCMTNGELGNDPLKLHGLEHGAFALGSGEYHCEKKPDFCPPLWSEEHNLHDAAGAFERENNMGFAEGTFGPSELAGALSFQSIDASFVFTCDPSHRVGDGLSDMIDCDEVECVDFDHEVTVTCVPNRDPNAAEGTQAHRGMYVFGDPVAAVSFHYGTGPSAMCVPQVCALEPVLNGDGAHDRSTPLVLQGLDTAWDGYEASGRKLLLFQDTATYGCGDEQLVQRKQRIPSHVDDQQCLKDDEKAHAELGFPLPGGSVTLTCASKWLEAYESTHDPACYEHCGDVLSSRDALQPFLTTTCSKGDFREECQEGFGRAYECDQGKPCRENAMLSCAAVHRMQDLGGAPGVGVKVGNDQDAHAFHLHCAAPQADAHALFHFQRVSERDGMTLALDAGHAYQKLLNSCGKQLRIVFETPRHHIADVCPAHSLVDVHENVDGKRYTEQEAIAAELGAEWADMKDLGDIACRSREGAVMKGKCFEAHRTGVKTGELYVTDCDEENVLQRFVYTTPQTSLAKGSSGQLVSLMEPEVDGDGQAHLWCVQMSEKRDGDPKTTFMDYKLAWCATDYEADEALYCSGEPEHLPNCQTFRSNQHNFDPAGQSDADEFGGDSFFFGDEADEDARTTPPTNVFSYVQPMTYTIEVEGDWGAVAASAGGAMELDVDRDSKEEMKRRGRPIGIFQYAPTAEAIASVNRFLQAIHPNTRVTELLLFDGARTGLRLTFDFRLQDLDAFGEDAQHEFFGALKATGLEYRQKKFPQAACGENERCGFLYFRREATVYVGGEATRKSLHDCVRTGSYPADACKYEMMFEAPNINGRQRVPALTYLLCYSNDISECS